nr:MAG TPA: hypothetical protein [Caudoviricetes sp.]
MLKYFNKIYLFIHIVVGSYRKGVSYVRKETRQQG